MVRELLTLFKKGNIMKKLSLILLSTILLSVGCASTQEEQTRYQQQQQPQWQQQQEQEWEQQKDTYRTRP